MMKIGALAKASGLSTDTLRFYEKAGLIASRRLPNGYRVFPPETLETLRLVQLGQGLGFTLKDMAALVPVLKAGGLGAEDVQALMAAQAGRIQDRIAALQRIQAMLQARLAAPCPLGRDCP